MYYQSLINQRVGSWTVLDVENHGSDQHTTMKCRCDCGTIRSVDAYSLKHGLTHSCGKCKKIEYVNGYGRCITKSGASFLFDLQDEQLIKDHSWSVARGHIRTTIDGKAVYLHQLVMDCPDDCEIDHINGDKSDNRRINLRLATHAQNNQNKGLRKDSTSGYKGVCLDKRSGLYIAYINAEGRRTYLGYFRNKEQAAEAYDQAACCLHGEFANLNLKEAAYGSKILEMGAEQSTRPG